MRLKPHIKRSGRLALRSQLGVDPRRMSAQFAFAFLAPHRTPDNASRVGKIFLFTVVSFDVTEDRSHIDCQICERDHDRMNLASVDSPLFFHFTQGAEYAPASQGGRSGHGRTSKNSRLAQQHE